MHVGALLVGARQHGHVTRQDAALADARIGVQQLRDLTGNGGMEPPKAALPDAAACALEPAHETWVLDDGDRPWVADMCAAYGARYVSRPIHDHAKAGNLNHALGVMAASNCMDTSLVQYALQKP